MDWRRAGSPTYGRRRAPAGLYSAPASPAHPLGPPPAASPVHPLAARSKARAAAAMAHAMSRTAGGGANDHDDDAGIEAANGGRYSNGGRSPLRSNGGGYNGYGGSRSPLHAAAAAAAVSAAAGGAAKDGGKYFNFALPKAARKARRSSLVYPKRVVQPRKTE